MGHGIGFMDRGHPSVALLDQYVLVRYFRSALRCPLRSLRQSLPCSYPQLILRFLHRPPFSHAFHGDLVHLACL